MVSCDICPRECRANRLEGERGFCRSEYLPVVATVCSHQGEEPAISGTRGSGTVFFGNCNLRCAYCQNHQISQPRKKRLFTELDFRTLAKRIMYLQNELDCHNINFVSPSHLVPQLVRTVLEAVPLGLRLPLVYNTSSYDSLSSLRKLDGIVDVYLADLRYGSDRWARKFSRVVDYTRHARAAIQEMYRQVGKLVLDEAGLARRGLIVRHLVLPNGLAGSEASLTWLVNKVSPAVTVSIMCQYYPTHRASRIPALSRRLTTAEYSEVIELTERLGLENGWGQEMESSDSYLPDFERADQPFFSTADLARE
ncbi:MAG: 4Fe-4S cluster-binding domain-containing protein [Dehalococcoidales bacterium]|nr:MAG: 4Fe-4S cluster-binding domain-containing protein [Dehalococcoidales bacterium]